MSRLDSLSAIFNVPNGKRLVLRCRNVWYIWPFGMTIASTFRAFMSFQVVLLYCFISIFSVAVNAAVEPKPSPLKIVTSIRPLALLVQDLAGDWASVDIIVPPYADPHSMSLKASSRLNLRNADLVLWLGPEFERFLEKPMLQRKSDFDVAIENISGLFDGSASSPERFNRDDEYGNDDHTHGDQHGRDLHVWLNPRSAELILRELHLHLIELRPELKANFDERLGVLLGDIREASKIVSDKLHVHQTKTYGVYHDAYGHFANAFGLTKVAAVNQLPEQHLSAKHLYNLQMEMKGASCLLVERKSDKTERLAKVLKVKQVAIDPLASDKSIQHYVDFLLYLGIGFDECFTS